MNQQRQNSINSEVNSQTTIFDTSVLEWNEESIYNGPFSNSEKPGYQPIGIEHLINYEESEVFDVPPIPRSTDILGPLYSVDVDGVYMPHLIDSISGGITSVSIYLLLYQKAV
jgi:hypothetical protein